MSIDVLQEKIRKTKNPTMVNLAVKRQDLPPRLLEEAGGAAAAYARFCREILDAVKTVVPAVRLSFTAFAMLGPEGVTALTQTLRYAASQGFYVALEAPELLSPDMAELTAEACFGENPVYPCDGLILSMYSGRDVIKPFLPYCKEGKDIFCVLRTSNKSAPELQDLLTGSRMVHTAGADIVSRLGSDNLGRWSYSAVAAMAGCGNGESLKRLRMNYPKLFLLVDDLDYPGCNAKNCSQSFDKFGHGAVCCVGKSVTLAWQESQTDGENFAAQALEAVQRTKKNLTRYTTVL